MLVVPFFSFSDTLKRGFGISLSLRVFSLKTSTAEAFATSFRVLIRKNIFDFIYRFVYYEQLILNKLKVFAAIFFASEYEKDHIFEPRREIAIKIFFIAIFFKLKKVCKCQLLCR